MDDLLDIRVTTPEPVHVGTRDAARILGVSLRTLQNLTKAGEIPCVRVRSRVLYRIDTLDRWSKERERGGGQ